MNEPTDRISADLDRALGELQAYVDGFVKKYPQSKANKYFKELETSIDKKEPIGLLRNKCKELRHAFPTRQENEVKALLEKLFDCFQVIDDPTGQANQCLDEQERMAQRTTGYTFTEFRDEMLTLINRYSSSKLTEKYNAFERDYEVFQIKPAQEGALDQLRVSATDLQDQVKDKIANVSPGCAAFLQELTNAGTSVFRKDQPKSQDQLPHQEGARNLEGRSKTTIIYTTNPAADHKSQMSVTQYQDSEQRSSSSIFLQSLNQSMRVKDFDAKKMRKELQPAEPLEKELLDSFVVLKEENARLSKNNERTTELEAQLNNTMISYDAHKNEALERENYLRNQFEEMQRKMMTELENTKSHFGKKLREAREEADNLKTQLEMMAEDNSKQRQRSGEEIHRLQGENRQLKSRVSELAGAKLMDNNPDIADLSDPNRAMKLGERFSSLYDDDWTDGYQMFTEKFKLSEEAAIKLLLEILLKVYEFCKRVADEQMDCLCNIFEHPCQDIPQALTMRPQKEKVQMTQKQHKELKDLRKQIALSKVNNITKQYMNKEAEEVKQRGDKQEKSMFEKTRDYHQKCVEVCWPMVLHDPPVHMDQTVKPGVKIDGNRFRLYGGKGDILEYLVWPCLLVQGGGLIARGVAKPTKSAKGVKKS